MADLALGGAVTMPSIDRCRRPHAKWPTGPYTTNKCDWRRRQRAIASGWARLLSICLCQGKALRLLPRPARHMQATRQLTRRRKASHDNHKTTQAQRNGINSTPQTRRVRVARLPQHWRRHAQLLLTHPRTRSFYVCSLPCSSRPLCPPCSPPLPSVVASVVPGSFLRGNPD